MRATLVFPPAVSPTYVPLAIATLAGAVRDAVPGCRVATVDANLRLWQQQAGRSAAGNTLMAFMRGLHGDFFDPEAYRAQRTTWHELEADQANLAGDLRRALDRDDGPGLAADLHDLLLEEILAQDPELVGFSLFGLAQLPWALGLAREIRRRERGRATARRRIVLGGAACSALRVDDLLESCGFIDGVLEGEGEAALISLCRGTPLATVPGLAYRAGSKVTRNPPQRWDDLDRLPPPDFSGLPLDAYFNPTPVLPVLYCRGCKWRRCRFCAHTASFGRYRTRAVSQLADELEQLTRRHGARHFYFADLYIDAPDLEALGEELLARRQHLHFHTLGRPVRGYSAARLARLAEAGCRWISWGIESGSQRLLDVAGKGTRPATAERVLREAHAAGISNLAMMLFGLPTATDADLQQTFAFLERVHPWVDAMTASPFALFEGTPFARRAAHFGLAVEGNAVELRVAGRPLRSRLLRFRERSADGSLRPPRGAIEADAWRARRRWLGEVPFLEQTACEHYLLHVAARGAGSLTPPLGPRQRAA